MNYIAEETSIEEQQINVTEKEPIKEKEVTLSEEKTPEITEELQVEVNIS